MRVLRAVYGSHSCNISHWRLETSDLSACTAETSVWVGAGGGLTEQQVDGCCLELPSQTAECNRQQGRACFTPAFSTCQQQGVPHLLLHDRHYWQHILALLFVSVLAQHHTSCKHHGYGTSTLDNWGGTSPKACHQGRLAYFLLFAGVCSWTH